MKPAFGIFRRLERRSSNGLITGNGSYREHIDYSVLVTRVVILWVTIWQYESKSI